MAKGTVKWFNDSKGFGFIKQEGRGEDVFVHHSAIEADGYRTLQEGQKVELEIIKERNGLRAANVRVSDSESDDEDNDEPDDEVDQPPPDVKADEGKELVRQHKIRERKSSLVRQKKEWALQKLGSLRCEVCGFIFTEKYGALGTGFIECHHKVPLHQLKEQETGLDDLALVCANCHRMLHRKREVLTIEVLQKAIQDVSESRTISKRIKEL